MTRVAVIKDGVVLTVAAVPDGVSLSLEGRECVDVTSNVWVGTGWVYQDGEFSPPVKQIEE